MVRAKKAAMAGVVESAWLASLSRPSLRLPIEEHAPYFSKHGVKLEAQKKDPLAWSAVVHRVTTDHAELKPPNKVAVAKGAPRDVIHQLLRQLGFLVPPRAVPS